MLKFESFGTWGSQNVDEDGGLYLWHFKTFFI